MQSQNDLRYVNGNLNEQIIRLRRELTEQEHGTIGLRKTLVIGHEEIKSLNEEIVQLRRELDEAQKSLAESKKWRKRLRNALRNELLERKE